MANDKVITLKDIAYMMHEERFDLPGWQVDGEGAPSVVGKFHDVARGYLALPLSGAVDRMRAFDFLPEMLAPGVREKYGEERDFRKEIAEPLQKMLATMSDCLRANREPQPPIPKAEAYDLFSRTFAAFDREHSYGRSMRVFVQQMAHGLELGILERKPKQNASNSTSAMVPRNKYAKTVTAVPEVYDFSPFCEEGLKKLETLEKALNAHAGTLKGARLTSEHAPSDIRALERGAEAIQQLREKAGVTLRFIHLRHTPEHLPIFNQHVLQCLSPIERAKEDLRNLETRAFGKKEKELMENPALMQAVKEAEDWLRQVEASRKQAPAAQPQPMTR